ncbi:hypothetical protein F5Y12DRAFT_202406 [Xylaria sp. FL1777]|nr:hypothetical protein F5Y12DRAFT_202406 [Xylaria sp. FL1777]
MGCHSTIRRICKYHSLQWKWKFSPVILCYLIIKIMCTCSLHYKLIVHGLFCIVLYVAIPVVSSVIWLLYFEDDLQINAPVHLIRSNRN